MGIAFALRSATILATLTNGREVHVVHPSGWYEGAFSESTVSRDGRWAFFTERGRGHVVEVESGRDVTTEKLSGFESVRSAAPYGTGSLALLGAWGAETGWFTPDETGYRLSALPSDAIPRWNEDGAVAYFRRGENRRTLHFRDKELSLPGDGAGLAWLPGGREVLVLLWLPEGSAELRSYSADGNSKTIARGLDAPFFFTSIAANPDGKRVYLALASRSAPVAEERHDPASDRDLDIYTVDLESGAVSPFFAGAGDDFSPALAGSSLFWVSNECVQQVVVLPIEGGDPRLLVEHGYLPDWSPDGRKLAFTVGDWRLADVPMNLDAMIVDVDRDTRAVSKPTGIVTGYHEDFTPVWSPDGKWLAYHSHRSPKAVSMFNEEGTSDDIYLRRADGSSPEIRLTDFGHEVGSPVWLPYSRRLVFGSQEPGTSPLVTKTWTVEIDPDSGKAVSKKELSFPAEIGNPDGLAFSPSGTEIALLGGEAIWLQDTEKGSLTRLASYRTSTHGGIDWTPDGKTLVYTALGTDRMEIFAMTRSGSSWSEPRRLASDRGDLIHPRISPDGRFIACTRVQWTKSLRTKSIDGAR